MANRSQNQFRRNSSRPNRAWTGTFTVASVLVPANSAVLLSTFALSNQGIDETVLRTVGSFYIVSDQTTSPEDQTGAFGLCKATDTALGVGVTAVPDPITNVADDVWFVYVPITQRYSRATAVGQVTGEMYKFDSKAKRIVSTGSGIAVVISNAHATEGFQVIAGFRMLTQVRGTR